MASNRVRPGARAAGRLAFFVLAATTAALVIVVAAGRLPRGTDTSTLVVRGAAGLAVGLVLIAFVRRTMRSLAEPPPPPPPQLDARPTDVVYSCTVCGTRLRLEVAVTGKAPRHCGEQMESSLLAHDE